MLCIRTLGGFRASRDSAEIDPTAWGREKAVLLFQFFVTTRGRPLHKEQIIDQLWPELDLELGDRDFRVALSTINRVLEPERMSRARSRYIERHGLAYGLNLHEVWVDADAFEAHVAAGNQALPEDVEIAIVHYQKAIALYTGDYLPERRYEDWTSTERERLQTLALATMTALAGLLVDHHPEQALESLRLTQRVLAIDPVWEAAYRVQMRAYVAQGNRPLALRTYAQCVEVLQREFGVEPLPETYSLYDQIKAGPSRDI